MIVFTTEISLQNLNSACADLCINRHGSQSFHIGSLLHEVLCLFVVIFWCLGEPRIYHIWAIEVFAALEGVPSDPIIRGGGNETWFTFHCFYSGWNFWMHPHFLFFLANICFNYWNTIWVALCYLFFILKNVAEVGGGGKLSTDSFSDSWRQQALFFNQCWKPLQAATLTTALLVFYVSLAALVLNLRILVILCIHSAVSFGSVSLLILLLKIICYLGTGKRLFHVPS